MPHSKGGWKMNKFFQLLLLVLLFYCNVSGIYGLDELRCRGRNFDNGQRCCTKFNPCVEGEGDCENDEECHEGSRIPDSQFHFHRYLFGFVSKHALLTLMERTISVLLGL